MLTPDAGNLGAHVKHISEKDKRLVMEQLWLTYFNEALFSQGIISESERNRMSAMIKSRTQTASRYS